MPALTLALIICDSKSAKTLAIFRKAADIPPVVEKPKKTVPAAAEEDGKEVEDLLRGSVVLFKEVQQIRPVPGKAACAL